MTLHILDHLGKCHSGPSNVKTSAWPLLSNMQEASRHAVTSRQGSVTGAVQGKASKIRLKARQQSLLSYPPPNAGVLKNAVHFTRKWEGGDHTKYPHVFDIPLPALL